MWKAKRAISTASTKQGRIARNAEDVKNALNEAKNADGGGADKEHTEKDLRADKCAEVGG